MQQQQQQLIVCVTVFLYLCCCCAIATPAKPLSAGQEDISDSSEAAADQPLKKPSAADFSDEDYDSYGSFGDDLADITGGGRQRVTQDHSWDVLIFTQQWPVTTCYHWREHDPDHECTLPQKKEFWTIHGIWPTKLGQVGPNFCNRSADFDVDQLKTISQRMETYWPDLDKELSEADWLWKHEWLKHGTCAALLETLDDELKYFGQGLDWREKYIMSRILDASDIHPDSNHTVTALNNAIVKAIGKNPSIHCIYDAKHGVSYLAEIRICFDKTLQLIDCDGVKRGDAVSVGVPGGTVLTNCHIGSPVHYPSLVPPLQRKKEWKFPLVNVYKLLQFLMWFTL